jgi:transposase
MVLKATPMGSLGVNLEIGLEAGPLSHLLYGAQREAGLAVELLETRHVKTARSTMPVKTDRISAAFDGAPSVRTAAVCRSLWRGGS